jgi:excisionase family DNA binding protein
MSPNSALWVAFVYGLSERLHAKSVPTRPVGRTVDSHRCRRMVNTSGGRRVAHVVGIRQLPSGAFQVRFQRDRASYVATYPTRELAEEAEPVLRAAVLTRQPDDHDEKGVAGQTSLDRAPTPTCTPSPGAVRVSSAAAAHAIDAILADVLHEDADPVPGSDEVLTTSGAAVLLGVSRPTVVCWLEAGRIPFEWRGTHRRVRQSDVLAYRDQLRQPVGRRQV